ncbi:peptidoglycan-binding domain-containing protein [Parasedimentitalea psychrophila]|uniref:peptidoglycan-binding domain-containing protein n=1 Tax=Parasedimentitalea psychrophila TaxID=2997337 RepID=UPI0036F26040
MYLAAKAGGNQSASRNLENFYENSGNARKLQSHLKQLGYLDGPIDGNFGPASQAALQSFFADATKVR